MTTVVQQQQRQPRRRRSVLQRILGDDTLSIVKRQTAKVELALLQRTEDDATLRSVGSGGQEAAAVIVAASSSPKGGTVVAQTKESYEQNIRRNQERARREQEIYEIETKLRSARLMSKKKRKSLELQMEEAKEAVRRLSESSFGGGGVGDGSGLPTRRISNTEMEFNDNDIDPSMTLEEIEAEKAKIKAQIDALTSFAGGGILGGLGGGGTMRPRRRISITESTMVIETVMDNNPAANNHQMKQEGISADAADDAAGPDASKRSNNAGESCISSSNNFESSCHSQTFFLDDLPGEDDEPTTQEEKDLKDAMDAIVMARLKAGRPLRRSSSTELSMMSESEEPWMEEEEGGAVDDADTTALASMAMFDFYKPRGSSGSSANNDNAKQRSSDAGGSSATSFFMNESESSTTDCDLLDDGPYSNRRPSYRSDISEIDIPWEGSSGKPQSDMPIRSTTKSILKKAPYRPERRGSGIHSDEFEQWWNPKVSALSRKLYILQQEAEAREESLKVISAEMVTKKDKNEEQIHKLMGHIRKLHKDSQETPMQLKYWQEKATDLSKKVYDLELLLEEQDDTINELLEFKEIQSERITTLEEEILQNRLDTFGSMVDEDGRRPQKKRLSRRASVDMTMQKSLRRASSCQSMDEQVKEEAKLEIIALESRLAKVNEEQVQLQRELDTMRALLESTTQQQEPTYEEKLIVEEKKVVRERLIYQLSCRQCKGKDLNFVGTTMLDIIDQVDVHFQEVVQQVQKMNGKGRRSDDVFTEGTNSTKWSATFAQHFAKHCRKKCKCADDVIKYCRKNVKIEILKKENGAELYWNDYEE